MASFPFSHFLWAGVALGAFYLGRVQVDNYLDKEGTGPFSFEGELTSRGNANRISRDAFMKEANQLTFENGSEIQDFLEAIFTEPNPIERQKKLSDLLGMIVPEHEALISAEIEKMPGTFWLGEQEHQLLIYSWARLSGERAMHYALKQSNENQSWMADMALSGWASTDPEGAKAWLESEELTDRKQYQHRQSFVRGLSQRDIDEATDYVQNLPDGHSVHRLWGILSQEQMKRGLEEAKGWVDGLKGGSAKDRAQENLAREYLRQDLAGAAAWAENLALSGEAAHAVSRVAEEWAENDPVSALQWVMKLPAGESQNLAMKTSFREWVRKDSEAAGRFLSELDPGKLRDSAALFYLHRLASKDPANALEWSQSLSDSTQSQAVTMRIARKWRENDEQAAERWLETSTLAPELVEQIRGSTSEE